MIPFALAGVEVDVTPSRTRPFRRVSVAVANKVARIAWAVMGLWCMGGRRRGRAAV